MTGGSSSEDQTNTITSQNAHHQHKGQEEEGKERNNNCSRGESNKHDDGVNEGMFTSTQRVQHDQRVNAEANIANPHRSSGRTTTESGGSSPLRRSKRDTNSIKLRGTATTFYRRMQILFFDESSCEDDYEEVFRSSRSSRGRRRRSPKSKSNKRQRSVDESIANDNGGSSSVGNSTKAKGVTNHVGPDPSCDVTSPVTGENWLRFMKLLDEATDDSDELQALPLGPSADDYQTWLRNRKEQWQKRRETSLSNSSSLPLKPTMQDFELWLKSRKSEWKCLPSSSPATTMTSHNKSGDVVDNSQQDSLNVGSDADPSSFPLEISASATSSNLDGAPLQHRSFLPSKSQSPVVCTKNDSNNKDDRDCHSKSDDDDDQSDYDNGRMTVRRVTGPDEAAIFVVDNFLTEGDLLYFDQKIRGKSLRFEKSFVDNMEVVDRVNHNDSTGNEEEEEEQANEGVDEDGTNHQDEACEEKKEENDDEGNKPKGKTEQEEEEAKEGVEDEEENVDQNNNRSTRSKGRIVVDNTHRTSTFVSFRKMQDSKIASIEQRIADMFGCFGFQIEGLQMVRYSPGQFFGVHHDMGELDDNDVAITPPKNIFVKRRLVTLFIYLNTLDVEQGGATYFPKCNNLRVRPVRGRAVIWSNVTQDGKADSRTIHAGEPVRLPERNLGGKALSTSTSRRKNEDVMDGTYKYGINVWICEE